MSDRFDILETPLKGVKVIRRKPMMDGRGFFQRVFCADELSPLLGTKRIAQVNHSLTLKQGSVRGMHFQHPPHAEIKLVTCLRGEVFDVAVDLRGDSPTFLSSYAEILTPDNNKTLLIPEGFAHGFQALADNSEIMYFVTAAYDEAAEGGFHPEDPRLGVRWPLPVGGLSPRDLARPFVGSSYAGIAL